MAYGRLDVFFPDGMLKTFLLTTSPVSIGRSVGNSIPLETDTISRYHISLSHQDGQVTINDLESANGTFVEGERLKHNVPHPLYGGEEILIGDLRIIFHNLDDSPTRPMNVVEDADRRVERKDDDFRVDVDNPMPAVSPGAHSSATVTIRNTSAAAVRYSVEITGLPKGWARTDRPELEIPAGEDAEIILSFKPIRRHDSAPGDYTAQVNVTPNGNKEKTLTCPVRLRVLPYSGFGMALANRNLDIDGQFRLYVQNQGSAPLPIALMGRDINNRLRFIFPMSSMTLAPGQRVAVDGRVRPRQPLLFGESRQHSFDLIVRSCDNAGFLVATRGYITEKPMLPTWAGFAIGGIGLSLIALLIVGLLLFLRPSTSPPTFASFSVNTTRIAQGTPIGVSYSFAEGQSSIVALVNGTLVFQEPTPHPAGTFSIDTRSLSGDVEIQLEASNRGGTAVAQQSVFVYAPLMVTRFDVQPPRLVRYVVQTVTVDWEVSGALSTQLTGFETWSQTPLESAYAARATVSVSGIPTAPIDLVLSAQSAEGQTMTQEFAIPVIDPQCTARADNTPLYVGPDITHQVVGSAFAATPIVVDARTQDATWLRFQLSGGVAGWGQRAAFNCADTFNPNDLRIVSDLPPTLTPLPTLTQIPTSTATASQTPSAATRTAQATNRPPTPTTAG